MLLTNRASNLSLTPNNNNNNRKLQNPRTNMHVGITQNPMHLIGASCPAKDCTCWSWGKIGHWDARYWSTSSGQKDPNKKPPKCGPNGRNQKQTHSVDVGKDYGPQCDEVHVNTTAINIDALTEACATVSMPAEIGQNHHGSLWCKIDTGASDYVMPFCIFAKLFPSHITTDGKPTGLLPCETRLTAYNGSNIPQFGALDTATEWTPKDHQQSKHLQTIWYVTDSPGPSILGLPSSSKPGIVQLNCAVELTSRCDPSSPPKKPTIECAKDRCGPTSPLNTSEDLIKAYPDQFEGIGQFPGTYHITLQDDAKPVVHAPRKCPIWCNPWYVRNLLSSSTKVLLFQLKSLLIGSHHLPTHGRQMGNYKSVSTQKLLMQLLDMITTKPKLWKKHTWTGWKHLLHQAWWNLSLPVHSPWLWVITVHNLQYTIGKVQICPPPLQPSLHTGHLSTDDGPDPHLLRWCDWHHSWCRCLWERWQGTWQTSPQIHESHLWTWACLQQG